MYNLPRYNEYFVLSLAVGKNDMMIQMVDKPLIAIEVDTSSSCRQRSVV